NLHKEMGAAPDNGLSQKAMDVAFSVAKEFGVTDILMTTWGDHGNECPFYAIMSAFWYAAHKLYPCAADLDAMVSAYTGYTCAQWQIADEINYIVRMDEKICNASVWALHNDLLIGMMDCHIPDDADEHYRKLHGLLAPLCESSSEFSYIFRFYAALCAVMAGKTTFSKRLRRAYLAGDRQAMQAMQKELPELQQKIEEFDNNPRAADTYIYTDQIDEFGAQLVCDTQFLGYEKGLTYTITLEDPQGNPVYANTRYCEESWHREYITVENPQLWYPVGYGEQPLYTLKITCGQEVLRHTVGIRTVKILQIADKPGTENHELCRKLKETASGKEWDFNESFSCFTPVINGKRIFCKGADWAPCDPFVSEVTEEKITRILELSVQMGLNMIRIWGGGMFESEHFYSECDRLGIMVTQDFLMACGDYPENEDWFIQALQKEAEYAATALRNHPSLVWWNGDNENAVCGNEQMKEYWGRTSALKAIGPVLKKLDPARIFLPSSPYGGDRYASKTVGTTHNTQFLDHFFKYLENGDLTDYKDEYKQYLARFIAEEPSMGAVSTVSLRRMMDSRDIYETEDMWLYHTQSNPALRRELFEYEKLFAEKVLGSFRTGQDRLFKLQYIQYEWVRISFELARRNLWFNSGLLYWMLADCWPAASGWALIDYYGMPKASYYSFKRCAKEVVGSVDKEAQGYSLTISNDGLAGQILQVSINKLNHKSGKLTPCVEQKVQMDGQSVVKMPVSCALMENEIIVCDLQNENVQDRCFYKEGKLELNKTDCLHIIQKTENSITVEATEYVHAVALEGNAVFSDSYFSLLPGQRRTVSFTPTRGEEPEITCIGYTLA
ncbi:MAG: hypothetical protein IJY91_01020, partial [Oscillospiraceae bacterium]|nr:hypothetical protein [Oscillospiraceae bacterium]